jgi:hypothetical protein
LCFAFQIFLISKIYFNKLCSDFKNEKMEDPIFMCNYCQKYYCNKQVNTWFYVNTLQNNRLNFKFISILNKFEECLIAPHLAFTQIFQLKGYGQYGMHGNIIHVVTNLNLVWTIWPWSHIWWQFNCKIFGKKLEYKSIYMLSYVLLNIMIKALKALCENPLY